MSAPVPPLRESMPPPPTSVSSPAPPLIESSPPPPLSQLSSALPAIVSSSIEPITDSMLISVSAACGPVAVDVSSDTLTPCLPPVGLDTAS
jgi:hypothetical protein